MIKNILAIIGVLAIVLGGAMFVKFKPMMNMMPMMTNSEMKPIMDVFLNDFDGVKVAASNLEEGAAETTAEMLKLWISSKGDIAEATVWSKKVEEGVELEDVIVAINSVATNENIRGVGELPLSKELEARNIKSGVLHVMSFCNPETARKMVDFSASMAAYLPCRVSIVEREDGLWLYTLNMDMMIKMGRKMSPELKEETLKVRNALWTMLENGASGEF